jgi:hypothetical protein
MTLLDIGPADFGRFLTVLVDRRLMGSQCCLSNCCVNSNEHVLAWCLARRGWNLRTWRKIHWSDESRFLLHVTNGWMRVWTQKYSLYPKEHPASCPLQRLLGSQCCLSTGLGLVVNGIRLTKRCNALSSQSDVTRGLPDLGKSFWYEGEYQKHKDGK